MAKGISTIGSASQQAAKLRTRGFIAFEIGGTLGRITKPGKRPRSAGLERRLVRMATFAATYLAHIKRRAMRGELATKARPYSASSKDRKSGRPAYIVAQAYSERTDAGKENWGDSSADWHRKAGSVPGNTTGLMWRGAQARNSGNRNAVMDFGGSSIGTSSVATVRRKETKKGTKTTARVGRKVRNQWKASAVFRSLGANVLQPTESEVQAGADMFTNAVQDGFTDVLNLRRMRGLKTTGNRRLYVALTRQMRRRSGRG